jgi:hypothetical protein
VKRIALLFLLPLAAEAQLALFAVSGTTETPVGGLYDFGKVATGDSKDVVFRARNQGPAAISITVVTLSGAGFSLLQSPALPYQVASGNFLAITVRFSAGGALSYSASFQVNGISTILLGTSVAAVTVTALAPCAGADPVDFGQVQSGSATLCTFTLSNSTTQAITVATLAVAGAGFTGPFGIRTPLQLQPGQVFSFTVNFTPASPVAYTGTLTVDTRTFRLTGIGYAPPLPKATLAFDAAAIGSGQQRALTMTLAAPAVVATSGNVTLSFTPSVAGVSDDPAVMFVATGSRKVGFTVNAGDTAAVLGGKGEAVFQTGTTAGTITFMVDAGVIGINGDPTTTIRVAAAAVEIDSATAVRRTSDIDVTITGFDNSYTAGVMTFTFFDTSGRTIDPGAIRADFTANFHAFFTAAPLGSTFRALVTFPVSGNASQVAAVEATLTNSAGTVTTQRVSIPAAP